MSDRRKKYYCLGVCPESHAVLCLINYDHDSRLTVLQVFVTSFTQFPGRAFFVRDKVPPHRVLTYPPDAAGKEVDLLLADAGCLRGDFCAELQLAGYSVYRFAGSQFTTRYGNDLQQRQKQL